MCIPFFCSGIEFHAELRLHVGHWFCSFSLAVDVRVKFTVFNGTIANERMFSLNIKREKWHQLSASSSINQNERVRVHRSQWCRTFDWPMPTTKSNIPTVKKLCSFFLYLFYTFFSLCHSCSHSPNLGFLRATLFFCFFSRIALICVDWMGNLFGVLKLVDVFEVVTMPEMARAARLNSNSKFE